MIEVVKSFLRVATVVLLVIVNLILPFPSLKNTVSSTPVLASPLSVQFVNVYALLS